MEVKIERRYSLVAPSNSAWTVLEDVRRTAACMPGAQISEKVDETHYKGIVKSKVGPAQFTFGGDIEVLEVDPSLRRLRMHGKGADKSGSTASMMLLATIDEAPEGGSVLVGQATVSVGGKLAQFGNRLIIPVMDALLVQFAKNFDAQALAEASTKAPESRFEDAATTASPDKSPQPSPTVVQSSELNVFSLLVTLLKGFFARLLGKS